MNTIASIHRKAVVFAGSLLLLAACSTNEPAPAPVLPRDPNPTVPGGNIPGTPGNGSQQPGNGNQQPGNGTNNPEVPVRGTRLRWSSLDHQDWVHNTAGQLVQYVSQYNSTQGANTVTRFTYEFRYEGQRLERLDVMNNYGGKKHVRYQYEGDRLVKAEEFNSVGDKMAVYEYEFASPTRLQAQVETHYELNGTVKWRFRKEFVYDGRGNLTEIRNFHRNSAEQAWQAQDRLVFSQYDNLATTGEDLLMTYPMLPGVRFRVNNPGRKQWFTPEGQLMSGEERYSYTADLNGKVISKTVSGEGGRYTGTFLYPANQ